MPQENNKNNQNNNENVLTPGAGMVNTGGERRVVVDNGAANSTPGGSTSGDTGDTGEATVPNTGDTGESVKALESKIEALAATLESLAGKLTAPVGDSSKDSVEDSAAGESTSVDTGDTGETGETTPGGSTSVDTGVELREALERVSSLEAELSRARYRDAIRDNAASAEVNVSAALDSDIVREALKEVDLADSAAVTAALKSVSDNHSYLKQVSQTRIPRSNGVTPGTKVAGSLSRTEFDALSYKDKLAWKLANPDAFSALMSH